MRDPGDDIIIIELTSGKEIYAFTSVFGIGPESNEKIGHLDFDGVPLSADDVCELADIAIGRWISLKNLQACRFVREGES